MHWVMKNQKQDQWIVLPSNVMVTHIGILQVIY